MTSPGSTTLFKILRFLEVGFFVVAVLVTASVVTGKIWLEHHFLRQEIRLGDGSLRIYGGKLYWDLQLFCDSARFDSPTLYARSGKAEVYVNISGSLVSSAPLASLRMGTLFIRIKPGT